MPKPPAQSGAFHKLKLFLALSRTPHGLIDMAAPCFAALLWLGRFPSADVLAIGLITVFAGYTAVYALNDVVGFRSDQEKIRGGALSAAVGEGDLDAMMMRHPMAQGALGFGEGLAWSAAWGAVAIAGAAYLNPVCVVIFLFGCILEAVYCLLWRISPFRTLVSGAVKTAGAVAAVFAVDSTPSPVYVAVLFLAIFLWEIGGQNAPNDWTDLKEDRRFGGKTIPVRLGIDKTADIILGSLFLSVVTSLLLLTLSQARIEPVIYLAAGMAAVYLLLAPAWRLHGSRRAADAMVLFNRASYYPLTLLIVTLLAIVF
ncbi:MAG: UbiA family prenyltransferase [Desulfobacterales bacterium]